MNKIKKKYLLANFFLFFLLLLLNNVYSQEYIPLNDYQLKSILNYPNRSIISLSGKWEKSYDDENWEVVSLPNSLNTKNKIIYRKTIKIQEKPVTDYTWHLFFLGLDDEAEIFFNEKSIANHTSMMVPFTIRIPSNFINEVNVLKIVVKGAKYSSKIIKEQNIYTKKVYTGIIRDVYLVKAPLVWINDYKIKTKVSNNLQNGEIEVKVKVSSSDLEKFFKIIKESDTLRTDFSNKNSFTLEASLFYDRDSNRNICKSLIEPFKLNSEVTSSYNINLNVPFPKLWNPNSLTLDSNENYRLTIKLLYRGVKVIDEISTYAGFKNITISNNDNKPTILINSSPFEIKGFDYIEDFQGYNQTLTPSRIEEDIKLIKMLGANTIRFKYSVPHPYFAYLCDKYGILMLIDIPIYDVPSKFLISEEIRIRMHNYILQSTAYYNNFTSLFGWGVSECLEEETEEVNSFSNYIVDDLKANSDKLIYKIVPLVSKVINSKNYDIIGVRSNIRNNSIAKSSTNYENVINELLTIKTMIKDKPVFFNYGIPIQPFNENGFDDPLSVDAQEYYIERIFDFLKANNFNGSLIWSFNDYLLNNPLLILNNNDFYLCSSGLIDRDRIHKRKAYDKVLQLFKNIEDRKVIDRKKFVEYVPISFLIVGILLCLIILFLINRFRRFREYLFRSIFRPYNFYADIRDQRILSTFQSYILGTVISINLAIYFSSILFFYKTNELTQYIISLFLPPSIQEFLFRIIWTPELCLLILSVFFYLIVFLIAFIIKLFSLLVKPRIYFSDTYTITIWSGVPFIALIPVSIILSRLLITFPFLSWIAIIILSIITIWVILRILKSVAIVFDVSFAKSLIFGLGFILLIITIIFGLYQSNTEIIAYFDYFLSVLFI